ncbi:MAG: B12-binding domain-containing radical SAM protein [Candidatus Scalinduaceae bacterium]
MCSAETTKHNMRILLVYLEPLDNEPMGLLYIGTVLKKEGYAVKLIGLEGKTTEDKVSYVQKEVFGFQPDIVGLSVTTMFAGKAEEVAMGIKKDFPKVTIVAGGPHPTVCPQETLKSKHVDFCIIGEGEISILDLVRNISLNMPSFENVKGIALLDKENKLITTEKGDYINNLDDLPFIDRELLPENVIRGRAGYPLGSPSLLLITVRGCPYNCTFCQPTVDLMFGKKTRKRSPENVVAEIAELKRKYDVNGLWINDDTFSYDYDWTSRFCNLMIQSKLNSILWHANGRINRARKDVLLKMRNAGCVGVVMTFEAGSTRIREEVFCKGLSYDDIINAYNICHEIGLPAQANIMLGSPTETEAELTESVNLIEKVKPHFMNASYTTALPGTYMYDKYASSIASSPYYKTYDDFNVGRIKKTENLISETRLKEVWDYLEKRYSKSSYTNRARHFFQYKYFRKFLYRRWRTLLVSKHPNFKHLCFDIMAILLGSWCYFKNRKSYIRT